MELNDPRLPPRFWAKVQVQDDCWIWTGAKAGPGEKYGYIRVDGKTLRAHRFAYEALVGAIPKGLQLDHLCRVRACVRPDHLEPVTNRENGLRGESFAAQQARRTHCSQGHPYNEENTHHYRGKRYCRTCNRDRRKAEYKSGSTWRPRLLGVIPGSGDSVTIYEIRDALGVKATSFNRALLHLIADGAVRRTGSGVPGDPFRHSLV